MLKYYINLNGNSITIANSFWGKETVTYNEELKSAKTTFGGAKHTFAVTENEEKVEYEISFGFRFSILSITVEVKRNGKTIFRNF